MWINRDNGKSIIFSLSFVEGVCSFAWKKKKERLFSYKSPDIPADLFAASIHRAALRTYTYINYVAMWKQLPVEINLSALLRQFSLIRLIYRLWNHRAFIWCKLNYLSGIMLLNENLSVAQARLMTKSCPLRNSYDEYRDNVDKQRAEKYRCECT